MRAAHEDEVLSAHIKKRTFAIENGRDRRLPSAMLLPVAKRKRTGRSGGLMTLSSGRSS
jgi:hypothetical protein